jgi:hypothetical protein
MAEAIQIQAVCMGPLEALFYLLKQKPKEAAQTQRIR